MFKRSYFYPIIAAANGLKQLHTGTSNCLVQKPTDVILPPNSQKGMNAEGGRVLCLVIKCTGLLIRVKSAIA